MLHYASHVLLCSQCCKKGVKHIVSCLRHYNLRDFTRVVDNLHCTNSFAELQPKLTYSDKLVLK